MRILPALLIALFSLPLRADPVQLDSERDRLSYSLGHQIGADFKRQALDINPEMVLRGLQDARAGAAPALSEEAMREVLAEQRRKAQAAQRAEVEKAAEQKRAAGRAFLEENKKKEGVVALPSGLQYRVLQAGQGKRPGPTDRVTVHYRGTLIDGSEFDSSYRRNAPASFPLNGVIRGWTEGLQLMQEGAKYQFTIPAELAYGSRGRLADETLVFEVELLEVAGAGAAH